LSVARPDDDGDELGGDIEGTESLDVEIAMTPTAAAPAGSSIEASTRAEETRHTQATLKLGEPRVFRLVLLCQCDAEIGWQYGCASEAYCERR